MKNIDTLALLNAIVGASFVGTWIVLGIGGFIAFYLRKDVPFKRRWFPRYVIFSGILFVFFSTTLTALQARSLGALGVLVVIVPAIALISYLNIKFTKFCDQCGATVIDQNWFSPRRYCSKCGAELDPGQESEPES